MPKVTMYVKETLCHKVVADVDKDTLKLLRRGGREADDIAGDYCSRETLQDGSFELEDLNEC